jgi:hypothetical protein
MNNSMMYAIDGSRVNILQIDAPTQTQSQQKNGVSCPKGDQRCIRQSIEIKEASVVSHSHSSLLCEAEIKNTIALIPCWDKHLTVEENGDSREVVVSIDTVALKHKHTP